MNTRKKRQSVSAQRAGSLLIAALLSASMLFYGAPSALAVDALAGADGSAGAASDGDGGSNSGQQESWVDQIDSMLASGDYVDGEVIAIVAPAAEYAGYSAAAVASVDAGGSAASLTAMGVDGADTIAGADASADGLLDGGISVGGGSVDGVVGGSLADGMLDSASFDDGSFGGSDLLLDVADTEELALSTGDAYENAFDEALPEVVLEGAQIAAAAEGGAEGGASDGAANDNGASANDTNGNGASGKNTLPAVQSSDVELYTLLVKQEGMTTEDILRELASDSRVVWAEPNYTGSLSEIDSSSVDSDGTGLNDGDSAAGSGAFATKNADGSNDGTSDRGASNGFNDAAANNDNNARNANSSNANAGANSASFANNANSNSSGSEALSSSNDTVEGVTTVPSTVASTGQLDDGASFQWGYVDNTGTEASAFGSLHKEGFDVNLDGWNDEAQTNSAGVIAIVDSGVDYTNPDLADVMFDMSPYVSQIGGDAHGYNASGDGGDSFDVQGHGTHCAGIAAASWNSYGVSGAANGAKLISVRITDEAEHWSTDSAIKAFSYLGRAADAGVDIRVANNSWGTSQSRAFYFATESMGQKGVAAVFASGNENRNLDGMLDSSRIEGESDYVTVVNAASMTGAAADYTNYSKTATDVFAPGSTILSTAISQGNHNTSQFIPTLIKDKSSLAAYSDFSQGSTEIEAWTGIYQPTGGKAAKGKVGTVQQTVGFDSGTGVLKITKDELNKANEATPDTVKYMLVSFKVPVDSSKLSSLSNAGLSVALSNAGDADFLERGLLMLEAVDSTGATSMIGRTAYATNFNAGWNPISVSTEKALSEASSDSKLAVHTDDNGSKYIWLNLLIMMDALNNSSADGILIDCVGAGSQLVPYQYMDGTSMAAPCVTGLAAVASGQMDGYDELDKSVRAAALTRVLKSSVTQYDAFTGLCTSNGMIDASKFSGTDEDRAPTIVSATLSANEETITIKGDSLGDGAGSVKIGGKAAAVKSWSENEVVVERPEGLVSGYLTIELTRADGKSCNYAQTIVFSKNVSENEVSVYEETIETPDFFDDCTFTSSMAALDGSLYVFGPRQVANEEIDPDNAQSEALCYEKVWRYEISSGTWSEVQSLPCRLSYASCTLWDGKLLVMGATASKDYGGLATKKLFSYDPATSKWSDLSDKVASDEIPHHASLVNVGDRLLLIGGSVATTLPEDAAAAEAQGVWVPSDYDVDTAKKAMKGDTALMTLTRDNVREFDLDAGSATVVGSCAARANTGIARSWSGIQTALCGNKLYLFSGFKSDVDGSSSDTGCTELECLTLGDDSSISTESLGYYGDGTDLFPAILSGFVFTSAFTATADGPVFAGLISTTGYNEDGSSTSEVIQDDTFLLNSSATEFKSIGKRVNYTPVVYAQALAYRGKLYVLAHDFDNGYATVMRATAVATNEIPGDVVCDSEGESTNGGEFITSEADVHAKTGDTMASVVIALVVMGGVSVFVAYKTRRKAAHSNMM